MSARQFQSFRAASLYCQACGKAMAVTERLLLVLPEKELFEYQCTGCGAAVGSREVSAAEQVMRRESARMPQKPLSPMGPKGPQVRIL